MYPFYERGRTEIQAELSIGNPGKKAIGSVLKLRYRYLMIDLLTKKIYNLVSKGDSS